MVEFIQQKKLFRGYFWLNGSGIGHYGRSMGQSPRYDLGLLYIRLTAEIAEFAEEGAKLMIENGWLEQPPQGVDRDQLANDKK